MYSIQLTQKLASYLSATAYFDETRYTVYTDVPVSLIRRSAEAEKNLNLPQELEGSTLNWLVCDGDRIVLAIAREEADPQAQQILNQQLRGIRYLFLRRENDPLPSQMEYDVHILEPSEEYLRHLYHKIAAWLQEIRRREAKSLSAHRAKQQAYQPPKRGYILATVPVAELEPGNGKKLRKALIQKRLLRRDGTITEYGCFCGLVCRYTGGTVQLTVVKAALPKLRQALQWKNETGRRLSLEERRARLRAALPSGENNRLQQELRKLLDMPLERVFSGNSKRLWELDREFDKADEFITRSYCPVTPGPRPHTYRECLGFLHRIRAQLPPDDCLNNELREVKESVLRLLAAAFVTPDTPQSAPADNSSRKGLGDRLSQLSGSAAPSPVLTAQLSHYYYAAACMTGTGYPNWLYREKIRPHLDLQGYSDENFDLLCLLKHALKLSKSPDYTSRQKSTQLLYDLLVAPLCGS